MFIDGYENKIFRIFSMPFERLITILCVFLSHLFGNFNSLDGHVFSIFVIVLAAAEAAVALAIIINLFKNIGTVDVDKAQEMKG